MGFLELFGQGNDSDTEIKGSFRKEHRATVAAQLALIASFDY